MIGRAALLALALIALAAVGSAGACAGNHSGLAESGGAGPASVTASSATASSSASVAAASSGSGASDGGSADAGPPGPTSLTIVNGVVDYAAIRLCFMPYPSGPDVEPWPKNTSGLAFASGAAVAPISTAVPSGVDVQAFVVAGDLSLTAGLGCTAILALASPNVGAGGSGGGGGSGGKASESDAGSTSLIVVPLAVVPASVFSSSKSVLLVPTGCMSAGHTDSQSQQACGMNYAAGAPNAGLVAVAMSRSVDLSHISLQAVDASAAMAVADVRVTPGFADITDTAIASSIAFDQIAPTAPQSSLTLADLGTLSQVAVKTYPPNGTTALATTSSSAFFAQGNVTASDFVDGGGFVFVAVGAAPGVAAGPWWHALTYALVRANP